jgi:hypothetical protein
MNDINEPQQPSPGASTGSTIATVPDTLDNIDNYLITTEINDSGRLKLRREVEMNGLLLSGICNAKNEKYAIYVISVSCQPLHSINDEQKRKWMTYRRYSEFSDLHLTIKKRFPALREFIQLPNKSFMNNTSDVLQSKRRKELNDYLVVRAALPSPFPPSRWPMFRH